MAVIDLNGFHSVILDVHDLHHNEASFVRVDDLIGWHNLV